MADLKIDGRMKVKTLKANFKSNFGSSLRVYKSITCKGAFADDDATLASLRAEGAKGGELTVGGNKTVGKFEEEFAAYTAAPKVVLVVKYADVKESASETSMQVCDAVWGDILLDLGKAGNWWKVGLADGRTGYLPANTVQEFEDWVASRDATPENLIATAKTLIGIPYMWAATSVKAMDCSGFTKYVYYLNGIVLRRDASQQCKTGDDILR